MILCSDAEPSGEQLLPHRFCFYQSFAEPFERQRPTTETAQIQTQINPSSGLHFALDSPPACELTRVLLLAHCLLMFRPIFSCAELAHALGTVVPVPCGRDLGTGTSAAGRPCCAESAFTFQKALIKIKIKLYCRSWLVFSCNKKAQMFPTNKRLLPHRKLEELLF